MTRLALYLARHSGEDPDELTQQAWLLLFETLADVDTTIGQPEYFLLQRVRWGLLDCIRKARLRRCDDLDLAPEPSESACDIPWSDFFSRLSHPQQLILVGLLEGLTFRELGEKLSCSSANIAYHMRQLRLVHAQWSQADCIPAP